MTKLEDSESHTRTKKMIRIASQAIRADKIAEELDGYVKNLSWYLDSLTVRVGSLGNITGPSD